jgi:L-lactate dehydrogenase (cytochrome)
LANLLNRYPSIEDLRRRAKERIPYFAWEYIDSGTGADECVRRNRAALESITLVPQFMKGAFEPQLTTRLFNVDYAVPFGVSPVGLTALMWPRAERILARTAAVYRFPYTLSTAATEAPETIGPLADGMGWFQLYPPRRADIRRDLIHRARDAGFTTPKITPRILYRCMVRQEWDGPLVLKRILTSAEAERAAALGFDGIMVSNHGGRQFDGAPAAIDALPAIAHAVGERTKCFLTAACAAGWISRARWHWAPISYCWAEHLCMA